MAQYGLNEDNFVAGMNQQIAALTSRLKPENLVQWFDLEGYRRAVRNFERDHWSGGDNWDLDPMLYGPDSSDFWKVEDTNAAYNASIQKQINALQAAKQKFVGLTAAMGASEAELERLRTRLELTPQEFAEAIAKFSTAFYDEFGGGADGKKAAEEALGKLNQVLNTESERLAIAGDIARRNIENLFSDIELTMGSGLSNLATPTGFFDAVEAMTDAIDYMGNAGADSEVFRQMMDDILTSIMNSAEWQMMTLEEQAEVLATISKIGANTVDAMEALDGLAEDVAEKLELVEGPDIARMLRDSVAESTGPEEAGKRFAQKFNNLIVESLLDRTVNQIGDAIAQEVVTKIIEGAITSQTLNIAGASMSATTMINAGEIFAANVAGIVTETVNVLEYLSAVLSDDAIVDALSGVGESLAPIAGALFDLESATENSTWVTERNNRLMEEQNALWESMSDFLGGRVTDQFSTSTNLEKLQVTEQEFQDLYQRVLDGDAGAGDELISVANELLGYGQTFFGGSGTEYEDFVNRIYGSIGTLSDILAPYIESGTPWLSWLTDNPESPIPSGSVGGDSEAGLYTISTKIDGTPQVVNKFTGEVINFDPGATGGTDGIVQPTAIPTLNDAIGLMGQAAPLQTQYQAQIVSNTARMVSLLEVIAAASNDSPYGNAQLYQYDPEEAPVFNYLDSGEISVTSTF
jgi:hypothetical protein